MSRSILWDDSTDLQDKLLINYVVDQIVVGSLSHKKVCSNEIYQFINNPSWKLKYTNSYFVHNVYWALKLKSAMEIKIALYNQAIENLYYHIAISLNTYKDSSSFTERIQTVFKEVYGWEMPDETARALKILRNKVAHTGTMMNFKNGDKQDKKLESFLHNHHMSIYDLIGVLYSLVKDILVRVLGLRLEGYLDGNGIQIWSSDLMGYVHGTTPLNKI